MVNYQQGKIYKIECNVTSKVYIGSTCKKTLAERLSKHRSDYKRYLNGKTRYVTSYDILENGDYVIVLIENYPCDSKDKLFARERYHTNTIECVNKNKNQGIVNEMGKTSYDKQRNVKYYAENKDYHNQYYKQYYSENKETINEKHSCNCGGKYTHNHQLRHLRTKKHRDYIESLTNEDIE